MITDNIDVFGDKKITPTFEIPKIQNGSNITKEQLQKLFNKQIESKQIENKSNKKYNVFYCTICENPEEALPNAQRVRPYVDELIIVHYHPAMIQVKEEFDSIGATLHQIDWKEDFSFKRTQYIRKTGEVAVQKGYDKNKLWMLISDSDEFPSYSLLKNLDLLVTRSELSKSTICTINAHDYMIKGEGTAYPFTFIPRPLELIDKNEIISHSVPTYHKELLVKYQDRLEYKGKVHHTLHGTGLKVIEAPKEYYYDHIKTDADLHSHGCRNWFIGGGGVQEFGEKWKSLRSITDKYNIDSWEKMQKSMRNGNIPSNIKQFFIDHKDDNDRHTDSELRSFYAYYKILHPRELENTVQTVKTIITKDGIKDPECTSESGKLYQFIESEYLRILGTNADPIKTKKFIEDINNGFIKKEDITLILNNIKNPKRINIMPQTKLENELISSLKKEIPIPGNSHYEWSSSIPKIKIEPNSINSPKIESNQLISQDINDSIIENEMNKIPENIRDNVINTYMKILRRYPDDGGLINYGGKMKRGMTIGSLERILRESDEYKEKCIYFK
jgi:hypothetical protein